MSCRDASAAAETLRHDPVAGPGPRKEPAMITCIIRYELDPYKLTAFEEYARNWDKVIPRCGADLIGYFAPHEGTKTTAYGIYSIADLAAYETYRARLKADPLGQENYALSQREQFIRREERQFFKLASGGSATLSG